MLHELLDMAVNIIPSQLFFFTDLVAFAKMVNVYQLLTETDKKK